MPEGALAWSREPGTKGENDLAPEVRANCIAPGFVATEKLFAREDADAVIEGLSKITPLRRLGTPAEVARAAVYAAESDFYHGTFSACPANRHSNGQARENRRVTDAEVIRRSLEDGSAFAELFDRYYGALHRFLHARVGVVLADDLASEVFVRAFRARFRYDLGREDARPWLFGIAVNLIREHRRSELRQLAAYARVLDGDRANGIAAADRLDPTLAAALLRLNAADRNLVLLFAWAQLTYAEIAQALEVPIGTVRSRLSRARATLRESLAPVEESL